MILLMARFTNEGLAATPMLFQTNPAHHDALASYPF